MSIIRAMRRPVKPHRISERRPGRFGAGVLPTRYAVQYDGRRSYTEDEVRWAAAVFGQTWAEDEVLEQRAIEDAMLERYTAGWIL